MPVALRRVRVHMQRDSPKHAERVSDVRNDGTLRTETLFAANHLVLTVRQRQPMRPMQGISGHDRVAMERQCIFSLRFGFDSRAFIKGQITRDEYVVDAHVSGDLPRYMAIGRSGHSVVDLGHQQQLAGAQSGIACKDIENTIQLDPALDIPGDGTNGAPGIGFPGRWEASFLDSTQNAVQLGLDLSKQRRLQALVSTQELNQILKIRLEFVVERRACECGRRHRRLNPTLTVVFLHVKTSYSITQDGGTIELESTPIKRRFQIGIALLLSECILGGVGYKLLSPQTPFLDCLYMSVITVTTVGSGEVISTSTDPLLRSYTLALILAGVGVMLYSVSVVTAYIVEGDLNQNFWKKRMQRQIDSMTEHFIVCDAGETGRRVIEELTQTKRKFVVIDPDPKIVSEFRSEYAGPILQGVSDDQETLKIEHQPPDLLAILVAGGFFGELALLAESPRTATVRTASPCTMLRLRRRNLETLMDATPDLRSSVHRAYKERLVALESLGNGESAPAVGDVSQA
jgi:hypothetical protein